MKKILYILLLIGCCPSCDILDVTPENQATYTNYFTTEQELESITTQLHSFIRMYLTQKDWPYHDIVGAKADETDAYISNIKNFDPLEFSNNMPVSDWHDLYSIVYMGNVMLDNIHRAGKVPAERRNFHIGQACFGKGVAYFFIVRHFGYAIITDNSLNMAAYGNSPAITIVDTVISNAKRAYSLLPKYEDLTDRNGARITSKQYGCKGSAAALLAHAYAWKGSIIDLYGLEGDSRTCYEQAIEWATKIILGDETGHYEMEDPETMCQTWSVCRKDNPESIFEIELDEISSDWPIFAGFGDYYITWPVNKKATHGDIITHQLRIYNTTVEDLYRGNDLRKTAYFYRPKAEDHVQQTRYAYPYKWRIGKYISADNNEESWQTLYANTVYWRLADIILLRAECYAKLGNDAAKDDLNTIRRRAHADLYPAEGDLNLQDAIFREREKELIFEGHRYFDIIRNGEAYILNELEAGKNGIITPNTLKEGILYYPINIRAFSLNEKLRQNLYWSKHQN